METKVEIRNKKLGERWVEFFEDNNDGLSMTRLLCFLSFFPAAYVLIISTPAERGTLMGLFLGAYATAYTVGKGIDAWRIAKTDTETPTKKEGDTNVAITVSPGSPVG